MNNKDQLKTTIDRETLFNTLSLGEYELTNIRTSEFFEESTMKILLRLEYVYKEDF